MGTLFEHGIDAGSNNTRIPIFDSDGNFTRPTLNGFKLKKIGSISLVSGDVTLSSSQVNAGILEVTTGHATNALQFNTSDYSADYAAYIVVNKDAVNQVNFKRTGGTACVIPAGKGAFVYYDGTEFKALPFA